MRSFREDPRRLARAVAVGLCGAGVCEACFRSPARAADVVSTRVAGTTGVWSAASNWANVPGVVAFPNNGNGGLTYDAELPGPGLITLDQNVTLQRFTLAGGALQGGFALTANEAVTFTGGTIAGTGVLNAAGGVTLSGGSTRAFIERTLNASNTTNWTGGTIAVGVGSVWNNAGTFATDFNGSWLSNQGGPVSTFNNHGAFRKSGGTGTTTLALPFNHYGTLRADVGTVSLNGGGFATGAFNASAGAVIAFAGGGSYALQGGATLTGPGTFRVAGAQLGIATAVGVSPANLELASGSIVGDDRVTVGSSFAWNGGTVQSFGGTGGIDLQAGSTSTWGGGAPKSLSGATINNAGTVAWNSGFIAAEPGAVINNAGSMTIGFNLNFAAGAGTNAAFNNAGSLTKSGGTNIGQFNSVFNNSGTVVVTAGTVNLAGGGAASGPFALAAGTALDVVNSNYALNTGASFAGAGVVRASGTSVVSMAADVPADSFELTSPATVTGGGTLAVSQLLNWTGGTMSGSGATTIAPGATFLLAGGTKFLAQRTLSNSGSATWSAGTIQGSQSSVIRNAGTFRVSFDGTLSGGGGTASFDNSGTFHRDAGTGVAMVTFAFSNTGTVRVDTGVLQLARGGLSTGSFAVGAGATLRFMGSTHDLAAPASVTGAGTVAVPAGRLNVAGAYDVDHTVVSGGGQFVFEDGPGAARVLRTRTLDVSGATARLDLTDNAAIVDYDTVTPYATVRANIVSAYTGTSAVRWLGAGITSSTAVPGDTTGLGYAEAADVFGISGTQTATWLGQTVDAGAVLVRFTLLGDATLDGAVDFNDLVRVAQNYGAIDGSRGWYAGDFTYDGNVDFNDLVKLAQSYGGALASGPIPGASIEFRDDLARAFASVPEPAAAWVVGAGPALLMRRRRGRGLKKTSGPEQGDAGSREPPR